MPPRYDAKGFELTELLRAGGDLARPNFEVCPRTGDFERAADENGEDEEAKASNPERFKFFGGEDEGSPEVLPKLDSGVEGPGLAKTDTGVFFPEEKMLGPLAAANGEADA